MRVRALALILACLFLSGVSAYASDLALVHARIYPSPTEPPIDDGTIVIYENRIVDAGPSAKITVPADATVIDCSGRVVTAGFWNSHVHLLTPGLIHAEKLSPEQLTTQLQEMFTRWGFTSVFDIASLEENTLLIRRRVESGEVKGPRILTVGEPFWAKTPVYVKDFLEANHITLHEGESPKDAAERARKQIEAGADGIKIFANSIEQHQVLNMPLNEAEAIVAAAHHESKPVFAHVSNDEGIEIALKAGVDILAHTTPNGSPWNSALAKRIVAAHMALTPTLTLWDVEGTKGGMKPEAIEKWMTAAADQLKAFSQAGGQVLFGTDIGYIDHVDTAEEFTWMSRAGMTFQQILASLTTNPAERFGSSFGGRVSTGMDADLVVLDADPQKDITAFSKVHFVVRAGRVIYTAP